jgi:hypothetical protein
MPMAIGEYKWRDRILLLFCWGTILFTAIASWASDGLPVEITAHSFQNLWQVARPYIYTIIPLVILLSPLLIWLVSRRITSFSSVLSKLQRPEVFWGLAFTFNLGLFFLIYQRFRNSHLFEFGLISLVVVMILWLFYRRISIDITKIILCTASWTVIIIIRQTLLFLQDKIDFFTASYYTQVYILLMVITLMGSVFLPLIVLFDRRRRITSKAHKIFKRIPIGIWALIFVLGSLWTFAVFWTMENEVISVMAMRLGAVAITYSATGLLLWVIDGEQPRDIKGVLPKGRTWYTILLSFLLIIYTLLAFHIGANNLENINPDGLSYLNIAREYAKGDLVVRGYWAPLISWLISPLIMLGIDPHVSYQVINGLAGFAWILITLLFARRAGLNYIARLALAAIMIVIVLSYGFSQVTPDIMGSFLLVLYFYWVADLQTEEKPIRSGIVIGISGALAYLAKYYNLPFIFAHLLLTTFLLVLHQKNIRAIAIRTITSLCVMMICISPWIFALNHRYEHFTITTSSAINHAIVGPDSNMHPCWDQQLCDQPSDVLFAWEDPLVQYYPAFGWSPFQSLENFRYQILIIKSNVWGWTVSTLFKLGPFLPFAFLVVAIVVMIHWVDVKHRLWHSWILLTSLLYVSGYMFTFSSAFRYYFPVLPILFIAGYSFLQKMFAQAEEKLSRDKRIWLQSFMVVMFAFSIPSLGKLDLIKYYLINRSDTCLKDSALVLKGYLEEPIAGTDIRSNYISYYTQVRTIGVLPPGNSAAEVDKILREAGVQTFIISSELDLGWTLVSQYFYSPLFNTQICDDGYIVLQVPD